MTQEEKQIIYTIREYENSIQMPENQKITYADPIGHIHLKDGDNTAQQHKNYAQKCAEYLRYGDEVDQATLGNLNPINQIKICNTPTILTQIGLPQIPMLYTQKHLLDAIHPKNENNYHWHGLTIPQIKKIPQLLETPTLLCDSPARKDVLLAVLTEVDNDKLPLILAIKPYGKGNYNLTEIETNQILSVYGKDDFKKYFTERITPNRIIYYNKKQGQLLETLAEIQFFRCHFKQDDLANKILKQPQCLVKQKPTLNETAQESQTSSHQLTTDAPMLEANQER